MEDIGNLFIPLSRPKPSEALHRHVTHHNSTTLEACCNLRCPSQDASRIVFISVFLWHGGTSNSTWPCCRNPTASLFYIVSWFFHSLKSILSHSESILFTFGILWHLTSNQPLEDLRSPLTAALEKGQVQAGSARIGMTCWTCRHLFTRIKSLETWQCLELRHWNLKSWDSAKSSCSW